MSKRMFALLLPLGLLFAAAAVWGQEDEPKKWHERLQLSGDFRLRYEGFDWEGNFDEGRRDRFRYRYRLRLEAEISDFLQAGASVRSGEPLDPVSDNRSFGAGFDKGLVSLAEIWGRLKPAEWARITVGKFAPDKLWRSADLEWDEDVNVEGAIEELDWKLGGIVESFEVNLIQLVGVEQSSAEDSYMFGAQAAPTLRFGEANRVVVGVGYEHWTNADNVAALSEPFVSTVDPTAEPRLLGNDMSNLVVTNLAGDLVLVSEFHVATVFGIWKNQSWERWPIEVSVFAHRNTGAGDEVGTDLIYGATGTGEDNDTALFVRAQAGDYKKPGQVMVRATRYDSDPDAILYLTNQSDTERSSNVEGWRADVRVGLPVGSYLNATYYSTEPKLGDDTTMERWQLDWGIVF